MRNLAGMWAVTYEVKAMPDFKLLTLADTDRLETLCDSPLHYSLIPYLEERRQVTPRQRHFLWILCIILGASLFYGIQTLPLRDYRETTYAEIGREMLADHQYLVPHLNGSPHLDKPPLASWLVGLSFKTFGVRQGVARLPSVLAVLWTALVVGWMTRRIFGPGRGILAAVLLLGTPGMQYYGRMLMTDTVFLACTLTALAAFVEAYLRDHSGWYCGGFVACGLGVLTRGLPGVVYPLAALVAFLALWDRQAWKRVPWGAGLLCLLMVTVPWFVLVEMQYPGFLDLFFVQHHVHRLNPAHSHPFVALARGHILLGFAGFLGPTLFCLPWAVSTGAGKRSSRHMLWLFSFFVLASVLLSTGRNHPYTMPALPPLVALVAGWLGELRAVTPLPWIRFPAVLVGLLGVTILGLLPWLPQIVDGISPLLAQPTTHQVVQVCMALVALSALFGGVLLWRGKGPVVCAMLAVLMLPGAYMLTHAQAQLAPLESRATLARTVAQEVPPTWPVIIANPRDVLFEGVGGWDFYASRQVFMVAFESPVRGPFWGLKRPAWILDVPDVRELWTSKQPLALAATPEAIARLPFAPLPPPRACDEKFCLWIVQH
jgi:4-amino-4-deoxy-L-arabinose transferase-like glycosyltransferase